MIQEGERGILENKVLITENRKVCHVYFYPTSSYDMVNEMLLHVFANLKVGKNYCISLLLIRSIALDKCLKLNLTIFQGLARYLF